MGGRVEPKTRSAARVTRLTLGLDGADVQLGPPRRAAAVVRARVHDRVPERRPVARAARQPVVRVRPALVVPVLERVLEDVHAVGKVRAEDRRDRARAEVVAERAARLHVEVLVVNARRAAHAVARRLGALHPAHEVLDAELRVVNAEVDARVDVARRVGAVAAEAEQRARQRELERDRAAEDQQRERREQAAGRGEAARQKPRRAEG